ncbi:MAG: type IV secretory system conjugative DNA transfer family protein [Lachnospiraceae bacterium]|nr:type IV secretory system conjugative DNA transfer family protein [Lachnospiraceae bacterium]
MSIIKKKWEAFKARSMLQKLKILLPYVVMMLTCSRIVELWRLCQKNLPKFMLHISYIYSSFPRFQPKDLLIGIPVGGAIVYYIKWTTKLHSKNTRMGEEYGSSRWGTAEDIKPFIDEDPFNNIILSQTEMLSMKPKMKEFSLNRNKHVIIYGGSGSGKTYRIVKPNLYQLHSSYVLTDPKGTLLPETGHLFEKMGYNIYVLDTIDMEHSMHYNPFAYIKEPKDILTMSNALYTNLKPPDAGTPPDPFFDTAALLWLQCIIGYLWYEAPPEEQTIPVVLQFLESDEVREDDDTYENAVDLIFKELEEKNPRHFAVKQRKKYKQAAGKTAKSILISLGAYLAPFDIPEVSELVSRDELHIDTYGNKNQKSILYVIISDTDTTYNFIPALLFTQMFNVLCYKADKEMGGALETPVQFILDEFANIGKIPGFKILIATIRSRLISVIMMLQTQSQLKDNYKEAAETIVGNCDSSVFLGGQEKSTLEDLEKALGDETIDLFNESKTFSMQESQGINYNKTGRKLMNVAELNLLNRDQCIVRISGLPPFLSDKYDTHSHPNYKYTGDANPKYMFDFAAYRKRKAKEEQRKKANHMPLHVGDTFKVLVS